MSNVIKQIYILQERKNFAIHKGWKFEDVKTTPDPEEAAEWKRSDPWRTYVAKDAPEEQETTQSSEEMDCLAFEIQQQNAIEEEEPTEE